MNFSNGKDFLVIYTAQRITGKVIPVKIGSRRSGDPSRLIANSTKAKKELLGWHPEHSELSVILETAWHWLKKHNKTKV